LTSNDVKITEGQARVLRSKLRQAWASGDCTAELDDAVRALDEQIENLDRRPRPRAAPTTDQAELNLDAIEQRTKQFAKRYPWRLLPGAKDFLPRDREALLAEVRRLREENALLRRGGSIPPAGDGE